MEKILSEEALSRFRQLTAEAQHIVICAHVNPDGDALGSSLAMKKYLSREGKDVQVVVPTSFPDFLRWLPGATEVKVYARHEEEVADVVKAADLFIVADFNDPSRLMGLQEAVMDNPAPKIMIDHHTAPSDFCQIVASRPEMCATAEVWCHLLDQMGELEHISHDEAVCIYTAMMCDTGAFTYASNRPAVYECIGKLLACGIDKDKIYRNVFWTASPARMKLMGYMLYVKMELVPQMHASIMTLTNSERRLFGIKNGDTEGFVNMPLQIMGMRLSVFLAEDTEHPGVIKVSLRSVDDFPCNEMAARFFNGGGHKNASGGRLQCNMEEAVKTVKNAIRAYESLLK
ncbi:MAG: DHH family phosphoesterase [Bacteroidaceae bacterium]|nr:DHH family phosphoesterase [Bacteroidaceae bacterium]